MFSTPSQRKLLAALPKCLHHRVQFLRHDTLLEEMSLQWSRKLFTRSVFEGIVLFSRADFGAFNVLNLSDPCYIRGGNFSFKPYKPEEKGGEKIRGT